MRKTFLFACAAIAATLSFTSCTNEVDMFENAGKTAKIDLNITNDDAMVTRASDQTADLNVWKASVTPKTSGLTNATGWVTANSLGAFKPGNYTIEVSNYATEAEVYSKNDGKGDAYYTGNKEISLVKGSNDVEIDCGTAKNCRVKADLSGITGVSGITEVVLKAKQTGTKERAEYTFANDDVAYFYANNAISYTLDYKYNGTAMTQVTGSIQTVDAAKEYKISIGTTDNGKIVLTIKYDNTFGTGTTESITIDAATGAEATAQP